MCEVEQKTVDSCKLSESGNKSVVIYKGASIFVGIADHEGMDKKTNLIPVTIYNIFAIIDNKNELMYCDPQCYVYCKEDEKEATDLGNTLIFWIHKDTEVFVEKEEYNS